MDVLSGLTSFSSRDSMRVVSGSVQMVNFRRLRAQERDTVTGEKREMSPPLTGLDSTDLFHSMAALYSAALPDMELEAIYSTLNKPARTLFVMATVEGKPHPLHIQVRGGASV